MNINNFHIINDIKSSLNLKIFSKGPFTNVCIAKNFNLLALNIQSLRNKLNSFTNFVVTSKTSFHVIVLSETHIKSDEAHFFNLPGYNVVHNIRKGNRSGGVSIFVKRDFSSFNVLHSIEFDLNNSLLIELNRPKVKILGFYRFEQSSNANFINHIDKVMDENKNCICVGDFNINLFKINSDNFVREYHDAIITNGFIFLNDLTKPTRVQKRSDRNETATLIDHLFSDIPFTHPDYQFNYYLDDVFGDHKALLLSIDMKSDLPHMNKKLVKIVKTNHELIKSRNLISNLTTVNFDNFMLDLKSIFAKYTVTYYKPERFRNSWMNSSILTLITVRENYMLLLKKYPRSNKVISRFKHYKNLVTTKIREAKKAYNDQSFLETADNFKAFWCNVNNLLANTDKKPQSCVQALLINGSVISNKVIMADTFNTHFVSVSNVIRSTININTFHFNLIHDNEDFTISVPFNSDSLETDSEEILNIITDLKSSDSLDFYGFSNNSFKCHKDSLAEPLSSLINDCLRSGNFPKSLKIARVIPLYKGSGSNKDMNEYRPISNVPIASKCFESVMLDRLSSHLNNNSIINPYQFGFTKGSNTEIATIHLLSEVYNIKDKKLLSAILFIDLQKAFDSVVHSILIKKLKKLRLPSQFLNLFMSYFEERTQYVQIDDAVSTKILIEAGVFQGSKLAACLFILYINNVFSLPLHGKIILYADDIAMVFGAKNPVELKRHIEEDLILLNCWLENHFLKMNLKKTKVMFLQGSAHANSFVTDNLNVSLNGVKIDRVDSFDYLGLLLDEQLKFSKHIDKVRSRVLSTTFAIKRIRYYISPHTALQLYFQHIHSILTYLLSCWSVTSQSKLDSLATAQKKALKIIYVKDRLYPSKQLFNTKILPLGYLSHYQTLLLSFKLINNLQRSNVQIRTRQEVTGRLTRQSSHFYIPTALSSMGYNDFFRKGFDMYNKLPRELKSIRNLESFKKDLKEFLFDIYFNDKDFP